MIEIAGVTPGATNGAAAPTANTAVNAAAERARAPAAEAAPLAEIGPLQRACLALLRGGWSSLAIVATDASAPARALAAALADVARAQRLRPVRVLDGAADSPAAVAALQDELGRRSGDGRTVVALDDPRTNPGALALAVHAEAVVLVVRLGASELRAIEETVGLVGRERVLGCVVAR
jgi:hypothetical protein